MIDEDVAVQDSMIETNSKQEQEKEKEKSLDRKVFRCLTCNFIPILTLDSDSKTVIIKCINNHQAKMPLSEYMQKGFLNSLDRVICSECNIKHEPKKVFKYCENCDKIYCKNCLKHHNKKYINHFSISVRKMDINCCKHELNFTYFCEYCQKNLCIKCINAHKSQEHRLLSLKQSKLSQNKINEIMDSISKEMESVNDIITFFNEKIDIIKNKFYESIKLQKQILKFKSNIVYTYNLKDTNYQIITNIKNIELFSSKFERPSELLDEFESIQYLFKFLNIIKDNSEYNTFNNFPVTEKIENKEKSEKNIKTDEKFSEKNVKKPLENETKEKQKNTWNKGKKTIKNKTSSDLSDSKSGFVEIKNNNLQENSGNSTNPKRKSKSKNKKTNNDLEYNKINLIKNKKYEEIIGDIDYDDVEIIQDDGKTGDSNNIKKKKNQANLKTEDNLLDDINIEPNSPKLCRSNEELSAEDIYDLMQSPIPSKQKLNNSLEKITTDIPEFQRKEMKIDFNTFFKNVKLNKNNNLLNNIPTEEYFISSEENSRHYGEEEDKCTHKTKNGNSNNTEKIINTNIKTPIPKQNLNNSRNNNYIINDFNSEDNSNIAQSNNKQKKRKKKLIDLNKVFISTTLSRSFQENDENSFNSSVDENENFITFNRSFNDEENTNVLKKSHPSDIIQKYRDMGCFGSKEKIHSLKLENGVSCITEVTPIIFAVGNLIGDIKIYILENFKLMQKISEHIGTINSIFKLHDDAILTASADKKMKKISFLNGFRHYNVDFVFDGYRNYVMKGIELSLNKSIISCSCDENVFIWNYEKKNNYIKRKVIKCKKKVEDILEVLNNEFITVSDNEIKFWKSENFFNTYKISGVRSLGLPNSLGIINETILVITYIHEVQLIDLIEHNYMGSYTITEGNLTTIISLNDGSFLLGEENLSDNQNIFWIKQYVLENDEFYYLSFKKNKFFKMSKENDKELRALIQFSNGLIAEGISGEINGKDYGDVFFYN